MFKRKTNYFGEIEKVSHRETAIMIPKILYRQESDWTCALACIRSITSSIKYIGSEEDIITKYKLNPGPLYSKDIKRLGILNEYDSVRYGCDSTEDSHSMEYMYSLLKNDYYVMIESMINYDHWLVLCAYFPNGSEEVDEQTVLLLLYDPYFNELKMYRAEELGAMWISSEYINNKVKCDYIAVGI